MAGSTPMPAGWEALLDGTSGRVFFVNHMTKQTDWVDPRPLPQGWEFGPPPAPNSGAKPFFIDHTTKSTTFIDPRGPPPLSQAAPIMTTPTGPPSYNAMVGGNGMPMAMAAGSPYPPPGPVMSSSAPPPSMVHSGYSAPVHAAYTPQMMPPPVAAAAIPIQQQPYGLPPPQRQQFVQVQARPGNAQVAVVYQPQPQAALVLVPLAVQYAGIPGNQLTDAQKRALRREQRLADADRLPSHRRDWVRRSIIWEEDMADKWPDNTYNPFVKFTWWPVLYAWYGVRWGFHSEAAIPMMMFCCLCLSIGDIFIMMSYMMMIGFWLPFAAVSYMIWAICDSIARSDAEYYSKRPQEEGWMFAMPPDAIRPNKTLFLNWWLQPFLVLKWIDPTRQDDYSRVGNINRQRTWNSICKPLYCRITRGTNMWCWMFTLPADLIIAAMYMFVIIIWVPLSYLGWGATTGWNRRVNFSPGQINCALSPLAACTHLDPGDDKYALRGTLADCNSRLIINRPWYFRYTRAFIREPNKMKDHDCWDCMSWLFCLPGIFIAEVFYVIIASIMLPMICLPIMSLMWIATCCGWFGSVKCPYGWINCWNNLSLAHLCWVGGLLNR